MLRSLLIVGWAVLCLTDLAAGELGTIVAEGDYVARGKDGIKPLAHWKIWRLRNGGYEIREAPANDAAVLQIFQFNAHFMPNGYTLKTGRFARGTGSPRPMSVSCKYRTKELFCSLDYGGHKSTALARPRGPYVFVPGEFYSLDFCWLWTEVVRQSLSDHREVETYVMTDKEGHPNEIALKLDRPKTDDKEAGVGMVSAGEETANALGESQTLKRYKVGGPAELSVLRVNKKGVVVSMGSETNPEIGFALDNYKEYQPWGPAK
jgi:hypothetical protein